MPPVVAAVATYVASAVGVGVLAIGASTAITTAAFWATYYITSAAIYYGVSRALSPKPKFDSVRSSPTQIMVQGTAESHRIIYGEVQLSGVFYPLGVSGTNNEYLHFLLIYAAHECNSFGTLKVNGEAVTVDGSGNVTSGKWANLMRVRSHLGAWDQTVDTQLQTELGSSFWPNTARQRGRAYDYIRVKHDQSVSGGGLPPITRLIQGRKVYDPRNGAHDANDPTTWTWSANAALCTADWVAGVPMKNGAGNVVRNYGFRATWSEISSAELTEAANICDEDVALAAGGTEDRYTCNGVVFTTATRGDVLDGLRSAMVGDVVFVGGSWIIRAGAYRTPNATGLTEDDFRAPIMGLQVKPSRRDLANGVKGMFTSPENNWQAADFPAYTKRIPAANLVNGDRVMIVEVGSTDFTLIGAADNNVGTIFTATGAGVGTGYAESYIVEDGGERLWMDIELPFTTSGATAQRIAKIHLERIRQTITFTGRYKLTALQHQPTDNVSQTFARYGWSPKVFRVEQFSPVVEYDSEGNPVIGCDMLMRENASGVYDWSAGVDERAHDVAPNTTLPNPFNVAAPTSLSVTNAVQQQTDGTAVPRLQVSWTAPADINVTSGGNIRLEYKLNASSDWLPVDSTIRGDMTLAFIMAVVIGQVYDVRIRAENRFTHSSWVTQTAVTVTGDTTAPNAPTGLAATVGTGKAVSLDWNDNTEDDFSEYKIFRNTTNNSGTATEIAEVRASRFVDVDVAIGTQYFYWLKAVDTSENVSGFSSGVNATPVTVPEGSVDATAPSTPSAPTFVSEATYLAGDGTVFARVTIDLPAMPSGGKLLQARWRISGSSGWNIGDAKNAAELALNDDVTIDDLTPGQAYEFSVRAISFANVPSADSSVLSRSAPNDTSAPGQPTGGSVNSPSGTGVQPVFVGGVQYFVSVVRWTHATDTDMAYTEVKVTTTNSDGATDYSWFSPGVPGGVVRVSVTSKPMCVFADAFLSSGFVRLRSVDRSGNASAWVNLGQINGSAAFVAGNLSEQNSSSVTTSGIKTGGAAASSVQKVLARYPYNGTSTFTGGSPTEKFNVSLSNRGFSTKPDTASGSPLAMSDNNISWRYDWDDAGNSSTNAVIEAKTEDGSNIAASAVVRFSIVFEEYD